MRTALAALFCLLLLVPAAVADTVHVVQSGENLWRISQRYGVTVDDIKAANPGVDESKLRVGAKLVIRGANQPADPPAEKRSTTTHTVKEGENLYRISLQYGVSVDEIKAANPGLDERKLWVGTKLKVPVAEEAAAQAPPDTPGAPAVEAPAAVPPSGDVAQAALWPLPGPRTAYTDTDRKFKHTRIAGKPGDPVVAVAGGRVAWVSPYLGYGIVVMIETRPASSREAYSFFYGGLADVYVRPGEWVAKGSTIARLGARASDGAAEVSFAAFQGVRLIDHSLLRWQ